jgi:RNA polymerase sigma factor (sigma-70 family)
MTTIDIVPLNFANTKNVNPKDVEFDTTKEYLTIARKTIRAFTHGKVSETMLKSDDAISNVATAIMLADWRWEPNKGKTKYSYRNQCAIWAIKAYMQRAFLPKTTISFNSSDSDCVDGMASMIQDKTNDKAGEVNDILENCLNQGVISNKQFKYIKGYYLDSKTYQEIADEVGVSRQSVEQLIKSGIKRLNIWATKQRLG